MVTMAASPSGTAATARDMAVRSMSPTSRLCSTATRNRNAHTATATMLSSFPMSASRFCRGVISLVSVPINPAIFPISVDIPVAVMIPTPLPQATVVDINAMLVLSPILFCPFGSSPAALSTGTDSPVSADSSIFRFTASSSRRSAGTCLPTSRKTISPGTRSVPWISSSFPSRSTSALGLESCLRASMALRALSS